MHPVAAQCLSATAMGILVGVALECLNEDEEQRGKALLVSLAVSVAFNAIASFFSTGTAVGVLLGVAFSLYQRDLKISHPWEINRKAFGMILLGGTLGYLIGPRFDSLVAIHLVRLVAAL